MTGVEHRVMRFTKAKAALIALTLMAPVGVSQAAKEATATLTINVTFTNPSCNITAPSSYNLGALTPGRKEHGDLNITWNCVEAGAGTPLAIKTGLTAAIVAGTPEGDDKVRLLTGGQASGATLSLKEKNTQTFVKLTGADKKNYFCSDATETSAQRTCTLTPVTEVSQHGPFGLASATLRFEVGYP